MVYYSVLHEIVKGHCSNSFRARRLGRKLFRDSVGVHRRKVRDLIVDGAGNLFEGCAVLPVAIESRGIDGEVRRERKKVGAHVIRRDERILDGSEGGKVVSLAHHTGNVRQKRGISFVGDRVYVVENGVL